MKTLVHPNGKNGAQVAAAWQLNDTLATLRKRFGAGAVITGDAPHLTSPVISTGFPGLDQALGIGGLPRGRIIDIYGPEGSGKTTLCLHLIAQAQRLGERCLFVDMECGLDRDYLTACGVAADDLYFSQPDCGEEALEIVCEVVEKGAGFSVVVVDSAAALIPRAELEGSTGEEFISYGSMMSQAMRKLAGPVRKTNTILVFTNQLRRRNGVLFGSNEVVTGGKALRNYTSIQIRLQSLNNLKRGGVVIGQRVQAVVKKNKLAPPFKDAEFDLITVRNSEAGQ